MKGKQVGAFALAVALIAGAWLIRTRVIDGDGTASPREPSTASTVVCVTELTKACRSALAGRTDVTLRIESANSTLERLGAEDQPSDEIWITMQPFPDMVERLRAQNRNVAAEATVQSLASSPLALVVAASRAESLQIGCQKPVDWRCLGNAAGNPWSDLDADAASGNVRPAFAPHPDTAIGQLGVAGAMLGYFGGSSIDRNDTGLITWSRNLSRASNPSIVAGSTAIAVMQTRPSAFDIAIGARAELADLDDSRFAVVQASPDVSIDIVAVVPNGSSVPDDLNITIQSALVESGWSAPQSGASSISADDMLLVRTLWEELT
jgi:hypothetical protein